MKSITPGKLLLSVMIILFLAASCKKDPNSAVKTNNSRSFVFKASASTPMDITISITRPSASMFINIDVIGLSNITGPYEYAPANVQAGDKIVIGVQTAQNQPITGSLVINGASIPYTTSFLSNASGASSVAWDLSAN